MDEQTAGLMNFLALLLVVALIVLIPAWWRARDRVRLLKLAAAAVERGQPLTKEALQTLPGARDPQWRRDLRSGILLTGLGLGVVAVGVCVFVIGKAAGGSTGAALGAAAGVAALGAIPGMIGLTLVLLSRLNRDDLD